MSDDEVRVLRVRGAPIDWALPAAQVQRVEDGAAPRALDLGAELGIAPLTTSPRRTLVVAGGPDEDERAIAARGAIDVLVLQRGELLELPGVSFAVPSDAGAIRIAFPDGSTPLLLVDAELWFARASPTAEGPTSESTPRRGDPSCDARPPFTS